MHTLHLLKLDKDKPSQRLLYSRQIQLFGIATVHQPLTFRFAQCVGSGPLSKIHQFVKAALFANRISYENERSRSVSGKLCLSQASRPICKDIASCTGTCLLPHP